MSAICGDCKGLAYVGGANIYECILGGPQGLNRNVGLDQKYVEERIPIECSRFDPASREVRIPMKEFIEVGITAVYGNGSVQIPSDIRRALEIRDGDKILWIRKGMNEYSFRKVGYVPKFKPMFR